MKDIIMKKLLSATAALFLTSYLPVMASNFINETDELLQVKLHANFGPNNDLWKNLVVIPANKSYSIPRDEMLKHVQSLKDERNDRAQLTSYYPETSHEILVKYEFGSNKKIFYGYYSWNASIYNAQLNELIVNDMMKTTHTLTPYGVGGLDYALKVSKQN